MSKPLETLKKIKGKSWEELRVRGEQAISVYSEQIGLTGKLPSDNDFYGLLDRSQFGKRNLSAFDIYEKFYENSQTAFFPSFAESDKTVELFRRHFGEESSEFFIEKAELIMDGRFDLLGYLNLPLGRDVDWHFEPISGKRSPLKHWKNFDELDSSETGDKKIVWELNRHQHFFALGVAFKLTNDERFAACFARHLESWMKQNPPEMGVNWVSSLEVAYRSMSWIWAFHFFKDSHSLTPELFQKAAKFLYQHGRHIEKYLSTYYSPNTHLTGEALGLYYLGTQFPFFKRAAHWRKLGEEILIGELDRQILKDGVYFEQSTWYQRYTVDFYQHFLILKTLQGDGMSRKSEVKLEEKLQAALAFLMYITRPDGTTPIIGDDDGGRMLPLTQANSDNFRGTLAVGAVIFERGDYKFVARNLSEEIVWLLGLEGVLAFETMRAHIPNQNSARFEHGGYCVMRDGWAETDNFMLVDGGDIGAFDGAHGHADALAVEVALGGRTLLVDSGTYTYHESMELRNYFRSTAAHNTLTIDKQSSSEPGGKFDWLTKAETKITSWVSEDRFDYFEGSHNGYERFAENPAHHTRNILFLKNDYWIMRDFVETDGEHEYNLNFHYNINTKPQIENTETGEFCIGENPAGETGSRLFTFGDNGSWRRKESWISNNHGEKINAPFLRFISKGTGAQEFFTFLLPTENYLQKPEVFENTVAGGRAFAVNYNGYWDLLVFADSAENIVRTEFFNTNFRFLWARLSPGETYPDEFVLIGGTHFSLGGREIVRYPKPLKFAHARRLGSKLNVRTSESIFSVSLPQRKPKSYILADSDDLVDEKKLPINK